MIYVLDKYDKVVTVLCTDLIVSEGIQVLSAKTKEINGGASTVEVTIDSSHPDVGLITDTEHQSLLFKNSDGEWQQFYIAEIEDNHTQFLTKTLFGESASQEVSNRFCRRDVTVGDLDGSPQALINYCLEPSRWLLGECDLEGEKITLLETKNKSVGELIQECASLYGADYRFRIEVDTKSESKILGRYVDFKKTLTIDKGKVFSVGKDIVSIKRSIDASSVKTAIIPVMMDTGAEEGEGSQVSISDIEWSVDKGHPVNKPLGQDWVGDDNTLQLWGYYDKATNTMNHRFMKAEFSEATTPEQLLAQAWNVLKMNSVPRATYEINVVDLYRLTQDEGLSHEYVRNGEKVRIIDKDFNPALVVEAHIVEIERDLLNPANDLVVIGNPRNTISDSLVEIQTELNDKLTIRDLSQTITQLKENTYYVENLKEITVDSYGRNILYVKLILADVTEVMIHFSACVYVESPCLITFEISNNDKKTYAFKPKQSMGTGFNIVSFNFPIFDLDVAVENRIIIKMYTDSGVATIHPQQANMVVKGSKLYINDKSDPFTGGEHYEEIKTPDVVIPLYKLATSMSGVIKLPINKSAGHKEAIVIDDIIPATITIKGE